MAISGDHRNLIISFKLSRKTLSALLYRKDAKVIEAASLYGFDASSEDEFDTFLAHYSHLEALTMAGRCVISDDHLKIIGSRLKKLRTLAINMNTSITDVGLSYLSGESELGKDLSCPLLENLDIERAGRVTVMGFLALTSSLPKLQHLGLWVDEMEDNVVECIAGVKSLKSVSLRNKDKSIVTEQELMERAGFQMQYRQKINGNWKNGCEEYWVRK